MLVTLAEMKSYLNISGTDMDTFLTSQLNLISETVEKYCGRSFAEKTCVQTFYRADFAVGVTSLPLAHYPVTSIEYITEGTEDVENFYAHRPTGIIKRRGGFFTMGAESIEVKYLGGFSDIPEPVKSVVYALVEERYNKKTSGIALNFGSDVQRVSIPGTISVDFDYSLQSNERSNALGVILGNYTNVLDSYRSERAIIGSGTLEYVD